MRAAWRERAIRVAPWVGSWLGLAAFYLATAPVNRVESDDSYWFAYDLRTGDLGDLVFGEHARHIAYLPTMRALSNGLRAVGAATDPYSLLWRTSSLVAPAAVLAVYAVLLRRFGLARPAAALGAGGLAVSYGFWRYADEGKVYPMAILLMALLLWVAFDRSRRSSPMAALAGAIAAVAFTFHPLAAIAALVAVPVLLLRERRPRYLVTFLVTFVLLAGSAEYLAYQVVHKRTTQTFVQYALAENLPDWQRDGLLRRKASGPGTSGYSPTKVVQAAVGFGADVISPTFLYAQPRLMDQIEKRFPARALQKERYLGRHSSSWVKLVPPVLDALLVLAVAALVLTTLRARRPRLGAPVWAVLGWLAVSALFLAGRDAAAPEAWIPVLLPAWLAVACLVLEPAMAAPRSSRLAVAAVALLGLQSLAGMLALHSRSADYNFQKAQPLRAYARPDDVILTADSATFVRYLRYETSARVVDLRGLTEAEVHRVYETASTTRVFATADVLYPLDQYRRDDPKGYAIQRGFAASVRNRFTKRSNDEFGGVYVSEP